MTYLAQVTIPYYTSLPTDVVTNTWHFDWAGVGPPGTTDWTALRTQIMDLYANLYKSPGTSMAKFMRPATSVLKIYNLDDPKPRVPRFESAMNLAVFSDATNSNLPSEVAVALSYRGEYISGTNKANRRGRIFLGGIGSSWLEVGTLSTFPLIRSASIVQVNAALTTFDAAAEAVFWNWVVYSPTLDSSTRVVAGWTDNAFDTQRRRGQAPSARTTWST